MRLEDSSSHLETIQRARLSSFQGAQRALKLVPGVRIAARDVQMILAQPA
jgi:hypothetical protein